VPTSGPDENDHPLLHKMTFYVKPDQVEVAAHFYKEVLGLKHVFGEPGHVECFRLGVDGLCLCLHEEEQGHPARKVELFFGTDAPARYEHLATALVPVTERTGQRVLQPQLDDGAGTQIRVTSGPDGTHEQ
jgi:catechol 2,3-dioxygenase-like lactoylglutathione lyase family enzyme